MNRIPDSYKETTWRCTTPVDNGRIGVAFGTGADTAIRLNLSIEDAQQLAHSILNYECRSKPKYLNVIDRLWLTPEQNMFLECVDITLRAGNEFSDLIGDATRLLEHLKSVGRSQPDSTCDRGVDKLPILNTHS